MTTPPPRHGRSVAAMFGRIARRYDLLNTAMTGGRHIAWRRQAARLATRDAKGDALDVATGTGDFAFALAHQPGIHRVVGVDFAPPMIKEANAKKRRLGRGASPHFGLADAMALPFPDNTFACATSGFALRNVEDVARTFREMARVVRPGGRVVILEIVPLERRWPLSALFRLYFHRIVPVLGRVLAGDREAYAYLPHSVQGFYTPGELTRLMEAQGLTSVGSLPLALGSVALLWGTKQGSHP